MEANNTLQLLGFGILMAKALALVFVIIWVRWTLPRLRVDQMMSMCWKYLIPLSFASFMCTAAWMVFVPEVVQDIVRYMLCGCTVIIFALFVARVRYNLKSALVDGSDFSGKLHY
jgi:NADH-quinone oxidoreductase subunit H